MPTPVNRSMYVAWRRPDRLIVPIGRLTERVDGSVREYRFDYLKRAQTEAEFRPLPGFPDLHRSYSSPTLFSVFANRVMLTNRPDYAEFIEQLNLEDDAQPFEVLQRSEGTRATDRIEVFPTPIESPSGDLTTTFFARAIRHVEGASEQVDSLSVGDELRLVSEPDNPANPLAVMLNTRTGERVGYVPDYLLTLIHDLGDENGETPQVAVEHINPDTTPPHLRLLCRLTAAWPDGLQPFGGAEFLPLVDQSVG
jgi:hypothetical protein